MDKKLNNNAISKILNNIFDDKCLYSKSGSPERGPGLICGFYILLIISSFIYNIVTTQKYLTQYGISRGQIFIQNFIDILLLLFNIVFIYHMCYICRGFVGFLVLLLIHGSIGLIRAAVFSSYTKASIKMGIDHIKK